MTKMDVEDWIAIGEFVFELFYNPARGSSPAPKTLAEVHEITRKWAQHRTTRLPLPEEVDPPTLAASAPAAKEKPVSTLRRIIGRRKK